MKGDITINVIITGLFAIGVTVFALYFLFKIFHEVHTLNIQAQTERDAILLANAIISHEKLIYEKDGVKYRGMLNASKLDSIFKVKSYKGFNDADVFKNVFNPDYWITRDKLDLGYDNTLSLILIIDLDDCNIDRCVAWGGMTINLNAGELLESHPFVKFGKCLVQSFDVSWGHLEKSVGACAAGGGLGAAIGSVIPGIGTAIGAAIGCAVGVVATLWTPEEIGNCISRSIPEPIKMWIESGNPVSHKGIPIDIVYENGNIHKGRLIVSLLELV
jgi:hypothetical protein